MLNNSNGTTPCPECGKPMPMVTWTGDKPQCYRCSGATITTTGGIRDLTPTDSGEERDCLHEALDDMTEDATHMLVCNCPKCQTR